MTVRESSLVCGVSTDTIRRRLADGVPGARRNDDGSWSIPVGGLAAVGLVPRVERLGRPNGRDGGSNPNRANGDNDMRERLAAAEALASARAEHIADLRSEIEILRHLIKKEGKG